MRQNCRRAPIVLILAVLLSACSGAPNADDLRPLLNNDLRANLRNAQSAARALGGEQGVAFMRSLGAPDPGAIAVENVKVLESQALDNGDYEVRVRYDIVAGDNREIKTAHGTRRPSGRRLAPAAGLTLVCLASKRCYVVTLCPRPGAARP